MNKSRFMVMLLMVLVIASTVSVSAMEVASLDTRSVETGLLSVQYQVPGHTATKIMLEKGGERSVFDLSATRTEETIPLLLGDGQYKVSILEHVSGNQYRPIKTETIEVAIVDPTARFLSSVQEIRWDQNMKAIQKAAALTAGLTTDMEKVTAIYEYIVENIRYDDAKAATVTSGYQPDIDATLLSGSGICYDYAALFAAMMRSVGVPARMAKGYAPGIDVYHAWNEILVDGEWQTMDTTMDAAYRQSKMPVKMFKDGAAFNKTSEV
ncbi:transglutaminase-like domain-containing protein [Anoxynatronum sibiricum]|uniref:Transglutaminase-like domain-containing protein n=1 Tax=Anoxynatronum sibiricum TaxID=210623 RepID=A0ABU9VVT1_9CLOT